VDNSLATARGNQALDLRIVVHGHACAQIDSVRTGRGKQPETGVSAIEQDEVVAAERLEVLGGQGALVARVGGDAGVENDAVEDVEDLGVAGHGLEAVRAASPAHLEAAEVIDQLIFGAQPQRGAVDGKQPEAGGARAWR